MAKRQSCFKRRLVIFAKVPILGTVKSRLAADIGFVEATRWYRTNCARLVRKLAADERWQVFIAVSPDVAAANKSWPGIFPLGVPRIAQGEGSLGERMARILNELGPGPVAIVGSDIPSIGPRQIGQTFRALGKAEVVLGPSSDGGYWLIGKRGGVAPKISLAHIRWSTKHTLDDTLNAFVGRRVELLDTLNDVDHASNLVK
jgi:rSAM/selenodomain-associated transferase 1